MAYPSLSSSTPVLQYVEEDDPRTPTMPKKSLNEILTKIPEKFLSLVPGSPKKKVIPPKRKRPEGESGDR